MTEPPPFPSGYDFTVRALDFYTRLAPGMSEPDLGGKLLYVGELDQEGRALLAAGNIAGAASLSASVSIEDPKQAIRDGILDFLVTSLDEALRILKNEIRKHAPVGVCVAAAPGDIELEMAERGVSPDLRAPLAHTSQADGAAGLKSLVWWSVLDAPARWMPRLDALALDCLPGDDGATRRWLRLGPRYLGRLGRNTRAVYADREFLVRLSEQASHLAQSESLTIEVGYGKERETIMSSR